MTIIWCMIPEIWSATDIIFCHFGLLFALLPPLQPKKLKFWKTEKMYGDIIILHMCTINGNHMMYSSSDMMHDRQNVLSFWTIFCPFTPLWTQKIKILEKWNKSLETLSFYTCVQPKNLKFWKTEKKAWRYYHFTHVYYKWLSYDV